MSDCQSSAMATVISSFHWSSSNWWTEFVTRWTNWKRRYRTRKRCLLLQWTLCWRRLKIIRQNPKSTKLSSGATCENQLCIRYSLAMFVYRRDFYVLLLRCQQQLVLPHRRRQVNADSLNCLCHACRNFVCSLESFSQNETLLYSQFIFLFLFVYIFVMQWLCLSTYFCSNNFLKIDVYYGQLKSEEVRQREAYDVLSFFSK